MSTRGRQADTQLGGDASSSSSPSAACPMPTRAIPEPRSVAGRYSTERGRRQVATATVAGRTHPGVHGRLDEAADPVAAHLGHAPVGVAQVHRQRRWRAPDDGAQHAVRPQAAVTVTQGARLRRRHRSAVVGVEQDQEVVTRPVVLGQASGVRSYRQSFSHRRQSPTTVRPPPGGTRGVPHREELGQEIAVGVEPHDARITPEPRPLPPGEGAGTRRTASATASSRGTPSSTWASSSR